MERGGRGGESPHTQQATEQLLPRAVPGRLPGPMTGQPNADQASWKPGRDDNEQRYQTQIYEEWCTQDTVMRAWYYSGSLMVNAKQEALLAWCLVLWRCSRARELQPAAAAAAAAHAHISGMRMETQEQSTVCMTSG